GPVAELVALDSFDGKAAENARRAAADDAALAYLGDFASNDVQQSAPILGASGLLAVAPVATFAGLEGPTLVRLTPHDGVGAEAIADWLVERDVGDLLVVHDHDDGYGVPVGRMCADAARERGIAVRSQPVWDETPTAVAAEALLYVGVAGSGAVALWRDLHLLDPAMWLLGSEGVAADWLARELEPPAAERTRFFVAPRGPWGFYGYEAMALILDAIAQAGDRAGVVALARGTRDRDSIFGRYSIDADGHTTSTAYGRLAVVDGELVWDRG
ncbi:MAG: branched-chain amino acid transport system substrate-binding protein, partial [Thermoleophilaceae bacterium]|nr:branched-chain amino acid transport system substrate-binding protein [Thermoleophilaceae bacterium]